MKTSAPFSAPQVPPVTGASRNLTPRSAQAAATRRASTGDTVLESTSTLPRRRSPTAPCSPHRICSSAGGSLTMVMSTSAAAAASRGEAAASAPCATNGPTRDAVRFHTVTAKPAFRRLAAIGRPIKPNPMNPTAGFATRASPNPGKNLTQRPQRKSRGRREAVISYCLLEAAPRSPCSLRNSVLSVFHPCLAVVQRLQHREHRGDAESTENREHKRQLVPLQCIC